MAKTSLKQKMTDVEDEQEELSPEEQGRAIEKFHQRHGLPPGIPIRSLDIDEQFRRKNPFFFMVKKGEK